MPIEYHNMPAGSSKTNFMIRYYLNILRTWVYFKWKYPWVKYKGFVRIMKGTSFARMRIEIGDNVQFGHYCNVASNVNFGNKILIASKVSFVGRNDHITNIPEQFIWDSGRGENGVTTVEDDVWIGINSTILSGVTIGCGSIVAAGSLVNKNIPPCEIWGGVPIKKIKDRFDTEELKQAHLQFLRKY